MTTILLSILGLLIALSLVVIALGFWLHGRWTSLEGGHQSLLDKMNDLEDRLEQATDLVYEQSHQIRAEWRQQLNFLQQTLVQNVQGFLQQSQQSLSHDIAQFAQQQQQQTHQLQQQLARLHTELMEQEMLSREQQHQAFRHAIDSILNQLNIMQQVQSDRLLQLTEQSAEKLEAIRYVVDDQLQKNLEKRLGDSFALVAERLELVHRSMGEMSFLAQGVGDLKKILTNVKTRGTWGEMQLSMLLEQMLTAEQYAANVETIPGSGLRVEFAIALPGRSDQEKPVWLPIDAKFPKEAFERLILSQEQGDTVKQSEAQKQLEQSIRLEAKRIREKYVEPPYTTDFAVMFLPTESLYAEIARIPGLLESLQEEFRVTLTGPTTLGALLNSLQIGFRTLALEKRSTEIWRVLGLVKTEFSKFGDTLAKTRESLEKAAKNIEHAEVRSRAMNRTLLKVENGQLGAFNTTDVPNEFVLGRHMSDEPLPD